MALTDKIVVLSAGNVEQVGSPNTLYHAPANRFVAGFIGSPKMNLFEGLVQQVAGDGIVARYAKGETQNVAAEPRGARKGDKVQVGIDPERLHAATSEWGVGAKAMTVESLGDAAYLYAEALVAPDGLIARIPPLERHERSELMKLGATPDHCDLFDANGRASERHLSYQTKAA